MAHKAALKALVRSAYAGVMPAPEIAAAAGVPLSTVRRWVRDLPAGAAPAPGADFAELVAAVKRLEREIAFDPTEDAVILPQIAVATSADCTRLRRTIRRAGFCLALLIVASGAAAALL